MPRSHHARAVHDAGSLPEAIETEQYVLGAVLIDPLNYPKLAAVLQPVDFALEKHRRIYLAMQELAGNGSPVDRVTVANELHRKGQLRSVDGLSYLTSLDDGMPRLANLDRWVHIIREKSLYRAIAAQNYATIGRVEEQELDAAAIASECATEMMQIAKGNSRSRGLISVSNGLLEDRESIGRILDPSQTDAGLRTGFAKFDEMTGGLRGGDLFILAARPAMGKTALALNIAQNVATRKKDPKAVAIYSLEMSRESLLMRMVCSQARVDQQRHRAGFATKEERMAIQHALAELEEAPIFIDDTAALTLSDLQVSCTEVQREHDLGLVVIDYLQLMGAPNGRSENRVQEIGAISRGFKLLAKELKVPFLVLSQLSRAPETRPGDHRPMLSDLRESGQIEQDADMVGFIFREEVYRPDKESLKGLAELILAKQRNGPTGRIKLAYLSRFTKFEILAAEDADDAYESFPAVPFPPEPDVPASFQFEGGDVQ